MEANEEIPTLYTKQHISIYSINIISGSDNTAVNGVAGGNSTVGTVTSGGLYAAPAAVPSPASVTVTAVSQVDMCLQKCRLLITRRRCCTCNT